MIRSRLFSDEESSINAPSMNDPRDLPKVCTPQPPTNHTTVFTVNPAVGGEFVVGVEPHVRGGTAGSIP
jgi:hypothetical protein